MSCAKCGHNKDKHQYQRDSQSHIGKCMVWKLANDKVKHPCWCQNYTSSRLKRDAE